MSFFVTRWVLLFNLADGAVYRSVTGASVET